jgi:hypothetical protein
LLEKNRVYPNQMFKGNASVKVLKNHHNKFLKSIIFNRFGAGILFCLSFNKHKQNIKLKKAVRKKEKNFEDAQSED